MGGGASSPPPEEREPEARALDVAGPETSSGVAAVEGSCGHSCAEASSSLSLRKRLSPRGGRIVCVATQEEEDEAAAAAAEAAEAGRGSGPDDDREETEGFFLATGGGNGVFISAGAWHSHLPSLPPGAPDAKQQRRRQARGRRSLTIDDLMLRDDDRMAAILQRCVEDDALPGP